MANFEFTEEAEEDLIAIIHYTQQRWGSVQAHTYIDGLEILCEKLAENPGLGLLRDELKTGVLSFSYREHLSFYLPGPNGISIVRVLHQSMDTKKQFE